MRTVPERETLQNEIIGQEDTTSEKERAIQLTIQGLGYMKIQRQFQKLAKDRERDKA